MFNKQMLHNKKVQLFSFLLFRKPTKFKHSYYFYAVATNDAPSCEVPSRRRTIKPPAWQKDYYMF